MLTISSALTSVGSPRKTKTISAFSQCEAEPYEPGRKKTPRKKRRGLQKRFRTEKDAKKKQPDDLGWPTISKAKECTRGGGL